VNILIFIFEYTVFIEVMSINVLGI